MGLAFYSYQEEEKKKQEKASKGDKGFFSGKVVDKATDLLFDNTKKLAGTAKAGAGGVYGLGKIGAASIFGDDEDYRRTVQGVDETLTKDLEKGKSFFDSRTEAQDASGKDIAKKIAGGGLATAAEVLPFARGASVATKGMKAKEAIPKLAAEGAGYGAAGNAGSQLVEEGKVDPLETARAALIGSATGVGGYGAFKAGGKVVDKLRGKPAPEKPIIDYPAEELDEFLPKKITVTGGDDAPVTGKITDGLPAARGAFKPSEVEYDDVSFRKRFMDNANQVLKTIPGAADQYLKSGSKDPVSLVVSHLSDTKSVKGVQKVIGKLLPNIDGSERAELSKTIAKSDSPEEIQRALYSSSENARLRSEVGNEVVAPSKNISFSDPQEKFAAALTGKAKAATVDYPLDENGLYLNGPLKGQPPLTTDVDTRVTSPSQAKNRVALAVTEHPTIAAPIQRAKQALAGIEPETTDAPSTSVGKGAQSIAQKLDEQLSSFNDKLSAPREVIEKLINSDAVSRKVRAHDWLDRYEDTLSVLGRHFGKVGTDLGYKLAEGAKRVSDIQEVVRPSVDKTQKLLNKISTSKNGRSEVQSRIYSALEDRAHARTYLRTKEERELFDEAVKVFDFFKQQRQAAGKSVIQENYSPRAAVSNALDAPERLLNDARSAFSPDVKSRFSKERVKKIEDAEINRNIIDLLPMYASSQSKEFGYEGAMKFAVENLKNVNPVYITDSKARRQGEEYLSDLLSQVLDPPTATKFERAQNKLIAQTYKATLKWSPRYALQNMTQRFATKSVVSKQAEKLAKDMDKTDVDVLRKGLFAGDSTITDEINNSPDSLGNAPKKGLNKFEPGSRVEHGNVIGAFDRGVAQELIESAPYKQAIKDGLSPKEAAKVALQDETVRELAIRRGNMVMNDTQFGANFVTKPAFFREAKTWFGLSDKWFKQYQRFPHGMIQNMSIILRANDARALDILKRGDPTQTPLVDFKYSAEALRNGVDDLIKGIRKGEISDVSLEVAEGYQNTLNKAIQQLDKGIKEKSLIRGGTTAKSIAKMWAAAAAIQWLFDGGFAMTEPDEQKKAAIRATQFGAPVSIPTKDQNLLAGAMIPSSPFKPELQPRRLLNFVPGVGVVANRGRELNRFVNALTGDTN